MYIDTSVLVNYIIIMNNKRLASRINDVLQFPLRMSGRSLISYKNDFPVILFTHIHNYSGIIIFILFYNYVR